MQVNKIGTIFTVSKENDISSITHSVSLNDVVHEGERIDQGKCCEGISSIKTGI